MNRWKAARAMRAAIVLAALVAGRSFACAAPPAPAAPRFILTFAKRALARPYTGRVRVMLASPDVPEPRLADDWFNHTPVFALDVRDWQPGTPLTLAGNALRYPPAPAPLPAGDYLAQAVLDLQPDTREIGSAPGNLYSPAARVRIGRGPAATVRLDITQTVAPDPFAETASVRLVDIVSPMLSRFYGRDVRMQAAVILPEGYDREPRRRYPTAYVVPGFGGTIREAPAIASGMYPIGFVGLPVITVVLSPDAGTGHHVFADSANNGPRGAALVRELIPHIERTYRCVPQPWARFLNGHSSGGWATLWLQITYPEFFGGTWSTSPDPVDFHAFQTVDIYASGANMFRDAAGHPAPLARAGGRVMLTARQLSDLEAVQGKGGQLGSFEAVFSPRGRDGLPAQLWDRKTGAIAPDVARAWRKYDICAILSERWPTLRASLQGKLHVIVGSEDTFYLDGAVRRLKALLARLGSDAVVEITPGRDHGSLLTPGLRERIGSEIMAAFHRGEQAAGASSAP